MTPNEQRAAAICPVCEQPIGCEGAYVECGRRLLHARCANPVPPPMPWQMEYMRRNPGGTRRPMLGTTYGKKP